MSRRPALKVGNLYYIKMKNVWVQKSDIVSDNESHEYIAEIIRLEPVDPYRLCIIISILTSTQTLELAELKHYDELHFNFMGSFNNGGYCWERAAFIQLKGSAPTWMSDAVFENFNPKNLPLYLNWEFGSDWVQQQLKGVK